MRRRLCMSEDKDEGWMKVLTESHARRQRRSQQTSGVCSRAILGRVPQPPVTGAVRSAPLSQRLPSSSDDRDHQNPGGLRMSLCTLRSLVRGRSMKMPVMLSKAMVKWRGALRSRQELDTETELMSDGSVSVLTFVTQRYDERPSERLPFCHDPGCKALLHQAPSRIPSWNEIRRTSLSQSVHMLHEPVCHH